uniref:uncharacterized protein LOC117602227 n=1 Tax=Osmia lignaria TaxID=473952 RepID=UPI001478B0BD|nr:uncharacterized protein LOC117602227 [Osmia lignaria]
MKCYRSIVERFQCSALQVFMQTYCNGEYKLLQNNSNMICFTIVNTSISYARYVILRPYTRFNTKGIDKWTTQPRQRMFTVQDSSIDISQRSLTLSLVSASAGNYYTNLSFLKLHNTTIYGRTLRRQELSFCFLYTTNILKGTVSMNSLISVIELLLMFLLIDIILMI